MSKVKIGWGESNICPRGGKVIIAGGVPFRATDVIHDEIKATAMVIESDGKRIIWVSCDFCHPSKQVEDRLIELLYKSLPGFKEDELILSGTHATACFYLSDNEILNSGHLLEEDEDLIPWDEAREQFCINITKAVNEAVNSLEYEDIEYASLDILTGLCRRVVYKDGTAKMYGNVHEDDFLRMEYPDGSETKAVYFYEKATHKLKAILAAAPCPAQADESSSYITADFWGYTRNMIKERFGENVKLLALCRAAGELSPHKLTAEREDGEWGPGAAKRLGDWIGENLISSEAKKKNKLDTDDIEINHTLEKIPFPARIISSEQYRWAIDYRRDKFNYDEYGKALDWQTESLARHMVKFVDNDIKLYKAKASVVKLGRIILFTAPAELFTEYAHRIIAKYPEYEMLDVQLTHDSIGYLPTKEAIIHGGYSTSYFSAFSDETGGELYIAKMTSLIDGVTENNMDT